MPNSPINPLFLQAALKAHRDYCETGDDKPTFDQWIKMASEMKSPRLTRIAASVNLAMQDPKYMFEFAS